MSEGKSTPSHRPADASFPLGAVFGDLTSIGFGERAPQCSGVKFAAVGWCSRLLPPGVVQITRIDSIKPKIVDNAKHDRLGVGRIAGDREPDSSLRSLG